MNPKHYFTDGRNPATDIRKQACRSAVQKAIRKGELPKLDGTIKCTDCPKPAFCYDHMDYSKPLAVDPVCKRCDSLRGPGIVPPEWGYKQTPRNKSKDPKAHAKPTMNELLERRGAAISMMIDGVLFSISDEERGFSLNSAKAIIRSYVNTQMVHGASQRTVAKRLNVKSSEITQFLYASRREQLFKLTTRKGSPP